MNKKINLWWSALVCIVCTFLLSGCDYLKMPSDQREYFTDTNGTAYYIINENYFTFDGYNVLEVIVSDSEKIILYDTENDDGESGVGEWIKDGVSYPIDFMDYDRKHPGGKHANIVITPHANCGNYWNTSNGNETLHLIAMINNNSEDPGLYHRSKGTQPYNWEFDDTKITVQYRTYTREDMNGRFYIPEKAAQFYSLDNKNVSFASDELNLWFDGKTGKGYWTLNEIDIPIIASFDQSQFILSVYYNTTDERQGMIIFSMSGTSVNDITENRATFMLDSFPQNLGYESNTMIAIEKNE